MQSFDLNIDKYSIEDIHEIFDLQYPYTNETLFLKRDQFIKNIENQTIDNKSSIISFLHELTNKCANHLLNQNSISSSIIPSPIPNHTFNFTIDNDFIIKNKLVTIHTEDRNKFFYPNQSEFTIHLPCAIQNIVKVQLNEINIPVYNDTILNEYQNTKFMFQIHQPVEPKLNPQIHGGGAIGHATPDWTSTINWDPTTGTDTRRLEIENIIYKVLLDLSMNNHIFTAEINEGCYDKPDMIINEIMRQMNFVVENEIKKSPIYIAWQNHTYPNGIVNYVDTVIYERFHVNYNQLSHKIEIYNEGDNFRLLFDKDIEYIIEENQHSINKNVLFKNNRKETLAEYMGFKKEIYTGIPKTVTLSEPRPHRQKYFWNSLDPGPTCDFSFNRIFSVNANYKLRYWIFNSIYMEFDGVNSIDELEPFIDISMDLQNIDPLICSNTKWRNLQNLKRVYGSGIKKDGNNCPTNTEDPNSNFYNVDPKSLRKQLHEQNGNGRQNSVFAKIPLVTNSISSINYVNQNDSLFNGMIYQPPIEEIKKCKFRFRYHNGYLVNFSNNDFDFTLQFTYLEKSSQNKQYQVQKLYNLL